MSTYEECLASFTNEWPHTSPSPQDLARLNLRHRPTSEDPDNVVCQICLHGICDWQPDEDPAIELRILHPKCSRLWNNDFGSPISLEKPSPKTIGFFDPSLKYDLPELCLFQNVYVFCDRIKRCRHVATDILDVLPSCLRGEALKWLNQSNHQDLAVCIRDMRARFAQAPPEAPLEAPQAPPEPPQAPPEPPQAPPEGPPEGPPQQAPQLIDYHHCKLCNASFSSIARLIRHTQENICNKPSCRHCEKVFSSKNQLHRHLREECQKWTRSSSASLSRSSSRSSSKSSSSPSPPSSTAYPSICSPRSSPQSSPTCSQACSPPPPPTPRILSPPPAYRAISPPPPTYMTIADLSARYAKPPYLNVDDLFRMFGGSSATTKSSITIASDDPFVRPFVSFIKSLASTQKWDLGLATSYHQNARAHCFPPRCGRPPPLLDFDKRQAMPNLV